VLNSLITVALGFQRAYNHGHASPDHLGSHFHGAGFLYILDDIVEYVVSELGMGHLSSSESYGDFDFVAFLQKLPGLSFLDLEVVSLDIRVESNLLDPDRVLMFPRYLFLLRLLVPVLAEVHYSADRRICVGRDFHEIEVFFVGQFLSVFDRDNAYMFALVVYSANRTDLDLVIYSDV